MRHIILVCLLLLVNSCFPILSSTSPSGFRLEPVETVRQLVITKKVWVIHNNYEPCDRFRDTERSGIERSGFDPLEPTKRAIRCELDKLRQEIQNNKLYSTYLDVSTELQADTYFYFIAPPEDRGCLRSSIDDDNGTCQIISVVLRTKPLTGIPIQIAKSIGNDLITTRGDPQNPVYWAENYGSDDIQPFPIGLYGINADPLFSYDYIKSDPNFSVVNPKQVFNVEKSTAVNNYSSLDATSKEVELLASVDSSSSTNVNTSPILVAMIDTGVSSNTVDYISKKYKAFGERFKKQFRIDFKEDEINRAGGTPEVSVEDLEQDTYIGTLGSFPQFPGHGTPIAWLIHSIAPQANIISYKVCDKSGFCDPRSVFTAITHAIRYAYSVDSEARLNKGVKGDDNTQYNQTPECQLPSGGIPRSSNDTTKVKCRLNLVVNLSLGRICDDPRLYSLLNLAKEYGVMVVTSVGSFFPNQGLSSAQGLCVQSSLGVKNVAFFPAAYSKRLCNPNPDNVPELTNLVSVGAQQLGSYSKVWTPYIQGIFKECVDSWAPGKQVLSFGSEPSQDRYVYWFNGTSFATAQITGLAARLRAVNPRADPKAIREQIVEITGCSTKNPNESRSGVERQGKCE